MNNFSYKKILYFLGKIIFIFIVIIVSIFAWSYYYFNVGYSSITADDHTKMEVLAEKAVTYSGGSLNELRLASNTFLIVPEWFIVYISSDYAEQISKNSPSSFPYIAYVNDNWILYGKLSAIIEKVYPYDSEYHTMVKVIGVSTAIEFGLKGLYENTIGYLFELSASGPTEIDKYAAKIAVDYVDFIRLRPWYEYDFYTALIELWEVNSDSGKNILRRSERTAVLSLEYSVKWGYAALIKWATHASYGVADVETTVRLQGDANTISSIDDRIQIVSSSGSEIIATFPRYHPFTEIAPRVTASGGIFQSIAGNDFVNVGVKAPGDFKILKGILLAKTSVRIEENNFRWLVRVDVADLGDFLNSVTATGGKLEHIYDF